jgi:hypothetical protein
LVILAAYSQGMVRYSNCFLINVVCLGRLRAEEYIQRGIYILFRLNSLWPGLVASKSKLLNRLCISFFFVISCNGGLKVQEHAPILTFLHCVQISKKNSCKLWNNTLRLKLGVLTR